MAHRDYFDKYKDLPPEKEIVDFDALLHISYAVFSVLCSYFIRVLVLLLTVRQIDVGVEQNITGWAARSCKLSKKAKKLD